MDFSATREMVVRLKRFLKVTYSQEFSGIVRLSSWKHLSFVISTSAVSTLIFKLFLSMQLFTSSWLDLSNAKEYKFIFILHSILY